MTYSQESLNKLYQFKSERKYIEMMALLADLNGGELLSTEYVSYKHQYEFLLKKGDKSTCFFRGLNSICQHENFKYAFPQSIENVHRKNESSESKYLKLKEKAVELGGELLEKEWLGCSVRHRFKIYNEVVMLTPKEVTRSGLATPSRGLITEPLIKQVFEHLFGYSFNKSRRVLTTDLTNSTAALELDGYCEELKIAFEYQGHPSHWRKDHERYEQTVATDKLIYIKKKVFFYLFFSGYFFNFFLHFFIAVFGVENNSRQNNNNDHNHNKNLHFQKTQNHYH